MNTGKILTQFKREFWESRAGLLRTPVYLGALLTLLLLLGIVSASRSIPEELHGQVSTSNTEILQPLIDGDVFVVQPEVMSIGLSAIYSVFFLVLGMVLSAYLLSTLYADRKDQSILFWKSLPVTEIQNVLTKLGTALIAAPAVYALAACATGLIYMLGLMAYGSLVWDVPLPGPGSLIMAFGGSLIRLVLAWSLLALWTLPLFTWLMLTSALAKKAPSLMALGLPLALAVIELWVFGSTHLGSAISAQIVEASTAFARVMTPAEAIAPIWGHALLSPALWFGFVISVLMIAASVWLRDYRYEL